MVYRGHVRGGVVVFDADVRLPEGIEVTIEPIAPSPGKTLAEQLGDLVGSVPDLPSDMAQGKAWGQAVKSDVIFFTPS